MIEMIELDEFDLAIVKMRGEITYTELLNKTNEAIELEKFKMRNYQITDVRGVKFLVAQNEIFEYLNLLKSNNKYRRPLNIAYIANESITTALCYMISEHFSENTVRSVFTTVEVALDHMGLDLIKNVLVEYLEMENE